MRKQFLDALKGPNGLMFDDNQIQSLCIHWVDTSSDPYFEVYLRPFFSDETMKKPITFFEMPDKLFYPFDVPRFEEGVTPEVSIEFVHFSMLTSIEAMTRAKRKLRIQAREHGLNRNRSYQLSAYIKPILRGFHKSRIIESGFEIVHAKDWHIARNKWMEDSMTSQERERMDITLRQSRELEAVVQINS